MLRKATPMVREMHSVFNEFFLSAARKFRASKPSPPECINMLNDTICVLRGYVEGVQELIEQQRSIARHQALPGPFRVHITHRDDAM